MTISNESNATANDLKNVAKQLTVEPLTNDAFAPFGQVIDTKNAAETFLINGGTTERFHDIAQVETESADGLEPRAAISIFRGQARSFPFAIEMLERHPYGSQAFVPLQQTPYLLVVAPALDENQPDVSKMRLFYAEATQGVNYAKGVWHHPLISFDQASDFLIVDRIGDGNNCDVVEFQEIDQREITEYKLKSN